MIGFSKALRFVAVVGIIAAVGLAALFLRVGDYIGILIAAFIGWQSIRGFMLAKRVAASGDPR